ncbi:MAG: glycosyltransferase family 4 protein [Clostridia bacterium]|nr:glycosyltransferase family 4 protein [Clostridia bacterium]
MITNKKIMMITTTDNMIWQFLIPHIKYLQNQGNVVECVCSKTGFWFDELRDKFGFTMHEIDFKRSPFKLKNIKAYKQLVLLQKQQKFDLVYCQQPVGGLMGRLIGKKFKIPVIYTAHGFHFLKGNNPIKNFLFKTVEKKLAKHTDMLITINEDDFQACQKWKAKKKFKISGIGFDVNKYDNTTFNKDEFKQSLGLKDEFVILTVAEFIKRKNYKTSLKTIAELKNNNVKYLICGRGMLEQDIKQQIKYLGIEDKVILLGYRKDINRIMQIADVFFLPSNQEGLCLSIIEGLNYGLPIVTSDVRGCKDLVEDGKNGYVGKKEDYQYFAKMIKKLIDNNDLREEMGEQSKLMSPEYSIENVLKQLEDIYTQL